MAKVSCPLHSGGASGSFGGLSFVDRSSCYKNNSLVRRKRGVKIPRRSALQLEQSARFALAVQAWQSLTLYERTQWRLRATRSGKLPHAYFIQQFFDQNSDLINPPFVPA